MGKTISETFSRIKDRAIRFWDYCSEGVWSDTRKSPKVNVVKTLNLSIRSFLNGDIQTRACAMTFRTMLAIVPALALIFAIGRGFGLERVIEDELISAVPSQKQVLMESFKYVDSYLDNSSEGIFLGIGIVFLLWTLVSLLSSVEDTFNQVWGIRNGRSLWRKVTDYLVIFILLPVLMVVASGATSFFSSAVQSLLPWWNVTPLVSVLLDVASVIMIWLFFTGVYMMVPNTKVKFKNAVVSGVLAGTAYVVLQWLFMTGQLYVSKYNAVYGGFAFLPLLLIWLQLVWVITLSGAVICYASQNFSQFNFNTEITKMSSTYRSQILMSIMAVAVSRYESGGKPVSEAELSMEYGLPASLVGQLLNNLVDNGMLLRVVIDERKAAYGYTPAIDPGKLTVGMVMRAMRTSGKSEFVPDFNKRFESVVNVVNEVDQVAYDEADKTLVKNMSVESLKN